MRDRGQPWGQGRGGKHQVTAERLAIFVSTLGISLVYGVFFENINTIIIYE